ncbi:Sorting nexin MVP1 [Wickerhamomyces ciferrii]|uniref:Sorting nexin MVP1 n=1 Tax=Wickerhamomyces ciferrii (strain ATCC 14091 / BCRC 22168 / CBS 111 / JCM 3599 / NBRC 0793 / NRRL Y-1031 F-60-10) TaxID=1206466 RepID=K0KIB9_WICCF|nr:Sorting nexin MVP1 [Wickerhamomyces ciferrii]CCH41917.1 Sorting nexin MVP1 [Wickerhamomyces ciferrii]
MSGDLFGNEGTDPWSLPTAKNTWSTEDDNDIPSNNNDDAFTNNNNNDNDDNNDDEIDDPLNGLGSGGSSIHTGRAVFEDTRIVSSINPLDSNNLEDSENNLHKSIWDDGNNDILAEPLNVNTLTGNSENHGLRSKDSNVDFFSWCNAIRKTFDPLARDIITISEIPEKEGLLFKHTNYLVAHLVPLPDTDASNDRKVIRRYSDFVWLSEILLKKYPFRLIPELPPKKLASNSDPQFLERRRRGLSRFINQIIKHPILKTESLVLMFLTVPTDLSSWRKHASYDTTEEYKDVKISQKFLDLWDLSIAKLWTEAREEIKNCYENWSKLSILVERFEKRSQQIALDNERFQRVLDDFKISTPAIYSIENSDINSINEHLRVVGKHLDNSKNLLNDESQNVEIGIVEDFKSFSDHLNSIGALFERYERLGGNQIIQLSRKVEFTQSKLNELNGKPDVRGNEVERYRDSIRKDKLEIEFQTNRDWLIKETILSEYVLFQETQYQITKIFQDWVADKVKYSELHSNNWSQLANSLQDMPITRVD